MSEATKLAMYEEAPGDGGRLVLESLKKTLSGLTLDQLRRANQLFFLDQMTCPMCRKTINRDKHQDPFICECGWRSA